MKYDFLSIDDAFAQITFLCFILQDVILGRQ